MKRWTELFNEFYFSKLCRNPFGVKLLFMNSSERLAVNTLNLHEAIDSQMNLNTLQLTVNKQPTITSRRKVFINLPALPMATGA